MLPVTLRFEIVRLGVEALIEPDAGSDEHDDVAPTLWAFGSGSPQAPGAEKQSPVRGPTGRDAGAPPVVPMT
jgi:hypothetical protein